MWEWSFLTPEVGGSIPGHCEHVEVSVSKYWIPRCLLSLGEWDNSVKHFEYLGLNALYKWQTAHWPFKTKGDWALLLWNDLSEELWHTKYSGWLHFKINFYRLTYKWCRPPFLKLIFPGLLLFCQLSPCLLFGSPFIIISIATVIYVSNLFYCVLKTYVSILIIPQ